MNKTTSYLEAALILDRGDQRWRLEAACSRHPDPDIFFAPPHAGRVKNADRHAALALCQRCPVRRECLDDAVECRIAYGIRAGLTAEQLDYVITYRTDRPDLGLVRAALSGQKVRLVEAEKRAVVRIAHMLGMPWQSWAALLGVGYKAASKRRKRAGGELDVIPARMRRKEFALANELREALTGPMAVASQC